MNRLNIINFINPSWFVQVTEFLNEHPAFNKLVPIVALDEYPNGFNKNPHETDPDAPINIFETVIWGLALAGCDVDYGKDQYNQMVKYLRTVKRFKKNKLSKYCKIFNGSSIDDKVFKNVKKYSDKFKNILVILNKI